LIYFWVKNILKSNRNHTPKQAVNFEFRPFQLEYFELEKFVCCKPKFVGFLTQKPINLLSIRLFTGLRQFFKQTADVKCLVMKNHILLFMWDPFKFIKTTGLRKAALSCALSANLRTQWRFSLSTVSVGPGLVYS
jgi:hypothetical protein